MRRFFQVSFTPPASRARSEMFLLSAAGEQKVSLGWLLRADSKRQSHRSTITRRRFFFSLTDIFMHVVTSRGPEPGVCVCVCVCV